MKTSYYTGYSKSEEGYKPDNEYFNAEHINQRISAKMPEEGDVVTAYCFSLTDGSVLITTLESVLDLEIDSKIGRAHV